METEIQPPRASIAGVLVVATLQGLLLWWLEYSRDLGTWPGNSQGWHTALLSLAIFMAPLIYGLAPWQRGARAWGFIAVIAALLLASSWQFSAHQLPPAPEWPRDALPFPLLLVQLLILFHAVPFMQIYLAQGRWQCAYAELFSRTWQNALQLGLAALFAGVFWLLLVLWAQLFDMIGLSFAGTVLFKIPGYALLVNALGFGIGFHLVGSAERLLAALRQQVLTLLKWLVPVAALILVAFSIALLARAPALLAAHRHVISAVWLLWLVIVSIYLINAAYQDGSVPSPYPAMLGRLLRWTMPLLLVLAALAAWEIWIRIDEYGLTTSRVWALLVATITLAYALGYALAARAAHPWMATVSRANVWVALLVIATLSLTLSPLLYPERLAARSQAARLARSAGTAGPSEFMALRFDYGSYGLAALQRLAAEAATPASIREGARQALQVKDLMGRSQFAYSTIPMPSVAFEIFPAGTALDDDLRRKIQHTANARFRFAIISRIEAATDYDPGAGGDTPEAPGTACSPAHPCPVVFADLDGDGQAEAVAIFGTYAYVFQRKSQGWQEIGQGFRPPHSTGPASSPLEQLRAGKFSVVEPRWKQLEIGNERLRLNLQEANQ